MTSRSKPCIRAILSDWGRVVVDFDNEKVGRALVPHNTWFNARTLYKIQFQDLRELFDVYMRGQIGTDGYRRAIRYALGLNCFNNEFDRAFSDVFTPNEPIITLWKSFRAMGVKMVAASNVDELRHAQLIRMGVHDLFDKHCLSYQVGCGKPDPAFFRKALDLACVEPEEALFVDDHPEFVEVARSQLITGFTYDLKDHAAFERFLDDYVIVPYQLG